MVSQLASRIRNNHSLSSVGDYLREAIRPGCQLPMSSGFFNVRAQDLLKAELDSVEHLDFLFGVPRFIGRLDSERAVSDESRWGNMDARE